MVFILRRGPGDLRRNLAHYDVTVTEAYAQTKRNQHSWNKSIEYLWCKNGFRDIWLDKMSYDHRVFHKYFSQKALRSI